MMRILHDTKLDFIKWWRWAAGLTAAFILLGLASFVIRGSARSYSSSSLRFLRSATEE